MTLRFSIEVTLLRFLRARQLEGDARDAFDLVGVVNLGVDGALLAVAEVSDGLRLAEINAAGEFAQDDDVEALDHLALEARGFGQRRIADRRPDVGEQAEVLAQTQQTRLGPHVVGHLVPFRPADRAEDHGVAGVRLGHGVVGDRDPMGVVAAAPDQRLVDVEAGDGLFREEIDEPLHLGHDFRADAVAGQEEELVGRHRMPRSCRSRADCYRAARGLATRAGGSPKC